MEPTPVNDEWADRMTARQRHKHFHNPVVGIGYSHSTRNFHALLFEDVGNTMPRTYQIRIYSERRLPTRDDAIAYIREKFIPEFEAHAHNKPRLALRQDFLFEAQPYQQRLQEYFRFRLIRRNEALVVA